LPDLNIDMDRVTLGRLDIDKAVSGQRHIVGFKGTVHIADRRLQLTADANAIAAPGVAGATASMP
jgi:translocation and assembly module TamB